MQAEIISDPSQLKTALHSAPKEKVFETVVRTLLVLPTTTMKSKFIDALSVLDGYSTIFSMAL
jgi:hypothetical protein